MEITCCFCLEGTRIVIDNEVSGGDARSSYKFCRGDVHIKRACFYIALSAIIVSVFSTVCLILGVYTVNLWFDIFLIILNTVVAIIMMIGLYYDKASLMIPFIVCEIGQCVLFFILANYVLYYTITIKHQRIYQKFDQILMIISIYFGIIICIAAIWAAAKCYHYLKQKADITHIEDNHRCMWE